MVVELDLRYSLVGRINTNAFWNDGALVYDACCLRLNGCVAIDRSSKFSMLMVWVTQSRSLSSAAAELNSPFLKFQRKRAKRLVTEH
jgi:hypothetical protein